MDPKNYTKRGNFLYLGVAGGDYRQGGFYRKVIKDWASKSDKPPAFIHNAEHFYNICGTSKSRIWIFGEGNIGATIGIPKYMFRDILAIECFPIFASLAVRDVCNKYAPGCYISKFPNDVVCKEHQGKTAGILLRRVDPYVCCVFGVNTQTHPPKEDLRKDGLNACSLKEHCPNPQGQSHQPWHYPHAFCESCRL